MLEGGLKMIRETWALTKRELKHWYRSKMNIMMLVMQPILMLGLFGQAFNIGSLVSPDLFKQYFSGAPNYVSFLSLGILGMTVMMTCMFSGMSIVWDRRFGFLKKLQVAPIPRGAIPVSRMFSSIIRSMIQTLIVLGIAISFTMIPGLTGLSLKPGFSVMDFLGIYLVVFLLAWIFSSLFVTIALGIQNQETMFGIINLLNMPLMFVSAIMFPTMMMPNWLKTVANCNPLTWAADAMRQFAFNDPAPIYNIWIDLLLLALLAVGMIIVTSFISRRLLTNK